MPYPLLGLSVANWPRHGHCLSLYLYSVTKHICMAGISKCESPAPSLPASTRPRPWDLQSGYLIRESISTLPECNVWMPPHPTQKLKKGEILQGFLSVLARNKYTLDSSMLTFPVCIAVPCCPLNPPPLCPGSDLCGSESLVAIHVTSQVLFSSRSLLF